MDLHDLNVFATAAHLGSVTKAAKSLATVQSNVTARIRLLERELDVRLFDRTHRGVTLTPKGQQLLPYAQQMLALADNARAAITNLGDVRGSLRIGSLQSTASARLPDLLKAYAIKYHRVDIGVETGTTDQLIERLLHGHLDATFIAGAEDHPDLDTVASFVEELVIITPAEFRSVKAYLRHSRLPKLLVFSAGCHYRQRLEQYVLAEGAGSINQMEFGTIDGIVGCVAAGLGIAMLPRSVIAGSARRKQVAVHKVARTHRYVDTRFVTRRGRVRSAALERLIEVIRSPAQRRASP
jgi:LysR family transcriptional regulator, cell division regulator